MTNGQWQVQLPQQLQQHISQHSANVQLTSSNRAELFQDRHEMQAGYSSYVSAGMQQYEDTDRNHSERGRRIAACIMEPVIQVETATNHTTACFIVNCLVLGISPEVLHPELCQYRLLTPSLQCKSSKALSAGRHFSRASVPSCS